MQPTRPLNAAVKAEVAANYNALMYTRIEQHQGEAHVFTTGLADLEAWWLALGGHITCQPAGDHVVRWSITTDTDHGHGAPLRIHALALDTDQIDAALAHAVTTNA